jgi:CO/xanthine dehydrogenase Mo-binding subunit
MSLEKAVRKVDAGVEVHRFQKIFAELTSFSQMLYAKILRSNRPYARIRSIDTAAGRSVARCKTILLGRVLLLHLAILPVSQDE